MKKNLHGSLFYKSFCLEHKMGMRLEGARYLMRDRGFIVGATRGRWSEALHIQRQLYSLVVRGLKPIPASVWVCLYSLGFRVDWFIDGKGNPLRKKIKGLNFSFK